MPVSNRNNQAEIRDYPCSPYLQPDQFIQFARGFTRPLEHLRQGLIELRDRHHQTGVLHLTGLPLDDCLPPTPINGSTPDKSSYMSELVLAWAGSILGEQVGYRQEKQGALFHQVTPAVGEEFQQSSEGSMERLKLHTERCFHPFGPDFLLLFCLRQDAGGSATSSYCSIAEIYPLLSPTTREILFQPLFQTGIDYSFIKSSSANPEGPVLPVLYGDRVYPCFRYDEDLMRGLTPAAEEALAELGALISENMHEILLQPGDMLVLDNRRAAHGRNRFVPSYSPTERWLQRIYVMRDLSLSINDRPANGRVIATEF